MPGGEKEALELAQLEEGSSEGLSGLSPKPSSEKNEVQPTNLEDLPDEILSIVLSHLPLKDYRNLLFTSQRLKDMALNQYNIKLLIKRDPKTLEYLNSFFDNEDPNESLDAFLDILYNYLSSEDQLNIYKIYYLAARENRLGEYLETPEGKKLEQWMHSYALTLLPSKEEEKRLNQQNYKENVSNVTNNHPRTVIFFIILSMITLAAVAIMTLIQAIKAEEDGVCMKILLREKKSECLQTAEQHRISASILTASFYVGLTLLLSVGRYLILPYLKALFQGEENRHRFIEQHLVSPVDLVYGLLTPRLKPALEEKKKGQMENERSLSQDNDGFRGSRSSSEDDGSGVMFYGEGENLGPSRPSSPRLIN